MYVLTYQRYNFFGSQWLSIFALGLLLLISAEDTVSSGKYLIHLCNSGQPGSEASKLQNLLPQVYDGLQRVIIDIQLGTASTHGYSAFFKNDSSKAEVLQVYQEIAAGASIAVGRGRGRNTNPISLRHPTFICANDAPETDLLYQYCIGSPSSPLMIWRETELIVLCPFFWENKEAPALSDCPLVVANSITPNDDRLMGSQEALLVGGLMGLYHQYEFGMVSTITDASELSASESLKNAPNYGFYYACECLKSTLMRQRAS